MKRRRPIALFFGCVALALEPAKAAESTGAPSLRQPTGTIEGRIFNPARGEYIRYAEIRIQGTSILETTASDGRYRIVNVPAGPVTVAVSHSGFKPVTASVTVASGTTVTKDFDLSVAEPGAGEVIRLDRFTVTGEKEGTAKAIMEQRNSMTIKNVVASDTFSTITEGNIGEVLQYLPGMQVRYMDSGEPANPLMRGMAAKYGALQIDGVRMTGGGTRAPELTSYSASATDTIEYSKTKRAGQDADAAAGTINMRSKSAFQRKGRYFGWQAYTIISAEDHSFGKSPGPEDKENHK